MNSPGSLVHFVRRRDYVFVRVLGQGACGQTVLLHDEVIDGHFVCKKYLPFSESHRQELFKNFLREIKLLHEVHHQNVVRVFNYYVYPEKLTGYILMEYVAGQDIEEHLRQKPESVNEVFVQAIEGFAYLESCLVLHRDIRPQNILVREDGTLKIIDLGFGKRVETSKDFDKSISLNWWCEPPEEFAVDTYDHATEVYFVGKLFEKLILESGIEHFKHTALLSRMCQRDPAQRVSTFFDVKTQVALNQTEDVEFTDEERDTYSEFAHEFSSRITKIESSTKYNEDLDSIKTQLESIYKNCMLESTIPDAAAVLRPFVRGVYYYRKAGFPTYVLKNFLRFLRTGSVEKQRIALANLHSRLNAIQRYTVAAADDDIPF
jgi:eukaryotic-like serine/threonine-protein kinase